MWGHQALPSAGLYLGRETVMRHFTLHITPRTTSPAVVCKTREFSAVARSRFSCDHHKVPAGQWEPKLVQGPRAPPRGLSGAPLWSLHPDAASQRIRAAGLSSRHLNQRSHKLCSLPPSGDCWIPPPLMVHRPWQRPRLGFQPRLPSGESLHSLPVTPCRSPAPQTGPSLGRGRAASGGQCVVGTPRFGGGKAAQWPGR